MRNEGSTIYENAESKVLEQNERRLANRLAKAAWRSLGYDSEQDGAKGNTPEHPSTINANEPAIVEEATKTAEEDNTLSIARSKPRKIRISDLFDKEELLPTTTEPSPETHTLNQTESAIQKFIRQNLLDSGRKYHKYERELSEIEVSYLAENNDDSNRALDRKAKEIRLEKQELAEESPEGHYIVYGNELRNRIAELNNGYLATTPSVERSLEHVEKNMATGQPTFIHGHLGGGKTELAITAAKRSAIKKAAYEEAESRFFDYIDANPNLSEEERLDFLAKTYRGYITRFEKSLHDGDPEATEQFTPLIISGSKDITTQDLFTDKTLKLAKFNGKTILEHKADLDAEFEKWKAENPEDAKDPQKSQDAANKILELFKLKNQAFGTEVKTIKQAIYRGVEEGRPVIIDEVNVIPTAILISLNDVLQRRPGDNCYIPGVGSVQIRPGFSITMTGNLTSNTIDYRGTEALNPAFESRLDIMEYDYLPMSETDRNYDSQANPQDNELFQVIVAKLADRQGNLRLPEIEKSLSKLFSLCQLAHEIQRIFSGKWRESDLNLKTASGDEMEPRLDNSVLSIRNILRVIKTWEKGRKGDLDKALWDGYISGITNPDDQNLTLALAQRYGFFQESDGWRIRVKERGAARTNFKEIYPSEYEYEPREFEVYSYRKVVDILYGPAPEREHYPDLDELINIGDDEINAEGIAEYESKIQELGKAISALEVLGEQCGCNVNDTNNNSNSER